MKTKLELKAENETGKQKTKMELLREQYHAREQ